MTNLPEKFSAGIRLAVEDMKKCELDSHYKIDMEVWHKPISGKCHVCMVGAVMAKTMNFGFNDEVHMTDFDFSLAYRLKSFDDLRLGYIIPAYNKYTRYGNLSRDFDMKSLLPYVPYEEDREKFYEWCLAVANEFERIGE